MNLFESGITLNCYMNKILQIKAKEIEQVLNEDYHIYFICSLPKAYFIEESIVFNSSNLTCEINYQGKKIKIEKSNLSIFDGSFLSGTTFNLSNDKSTITLSYYKEFIKQEDIILSANEIVESSGIKAEKKEKVLYIGQAFAKHGNRTAGVRLESHPTFQKILIDLQNSGADDEIHIFLMNFKMEHVLQLSGKNVIENELIANIFVNTMNDYTQAMCINIVEASLINYFQPKYNTQHKKQVCNKGSEKFKIFYKNKISKFLVQILPIKYHFEGLKQGYELMPRIVFYTDAIEYKTNSPQEFIMVNLDQKTYSTFSQLIKI